MKLAFDTKLAEGVSNLVSYAGCPGHAIIR